MKGESLVDREMTAYHEAGHAAAALALGLPLASVELRDGKEWNGVALLEQQAAADLGVLSAAASAGPVERERFLERVRAHITMMLAGWVAARLAIRYRRGPVAEQLSEAFIMRRYTGDIEQFVQTVSDLRRDHPDVNVDELLESAVCVVHGHDQDLERAREFASWHEHDEATRRELLAFCNLRAQSIIGEHWGAVDRIAQALLRATDGRLSGDDARALLDDERRSAPL